jgi:hypothetical protein
MATYPKSKNNRQCIGPCYPAGTMIMHPVSLEYITNDNYPFCPVDLWKDKHGVVIPIDQCRVPTKIDAITEKQIEMDVITPTINFDPKQFIKLYYKIESFNDAILWAYEHNNAPIDTLERILDCAWKGYGLELQDIGDNITEFYIDLIKSFWIDSYYLKLKNKLFIDANGQVAVLPKNKSPSTIKDSAYFKKQKKEFILSQLSQVTLKDLIQSYINKYKHKWFEIPSHSKKLKKFILDHLMAQVEK